MEPLTPDEQTALDLLRQGRSDEHVEAATGLDLERILYLRAQAASRAFTSPS